MDSKTLTTVLVVIACVLLFPLFICIIGGVVGAMGAAIGTVFGVFGSVIGAIFGAIGAVVGAVFGAFGWIFGYHDHWPFEIFNRQFFATVIIVLLVIAIVRSRKDQLRRDRAKRP